MAFFTIVFFWVYFLFLASAFVSILFMFIVYRLTGGKRSFRSWLRRMQS